VIVALALVWFAHLAANGLYLARDGQETRLFDSTYHLEFVYQVVAGIEHGGLTGLRQELPSSVEWPPLTHLVLGLLASTVDAALPAVRLYNLLFLGLLLVGVYGCGRRLAHVAAYPARTARAVGCWPPRCARCSRQSTAARARWAWTSPPRRWSRWP